MPNYDGIIKGGTAKSKAMTKLSKWEKQSSNVSIYISIKKKVIDGKTVTVMCVNRDMPLEGDGKMPLPREYTNREEFKKYLDSMIDGIEKAI